MTRLILAAGVAALAIAAPASAQRGEQGGNKGQSAKSERGGKAASAKDRGGQRAAADRGNRGNARAAKVDRREARAAVRGNDRREARVAVRDRGDDRRDARIDRRDREVRVANRVDRRIDRRIDRQDDRRGGVWIRDINDARFTPGRGVALSNGCPPGLMDKGCIPPGQAKNLLGRMIPASYRGSRLPQGLRDIYRDDDDYYYRYGDGYMYRVERRSNLVDSLLPLFGGGYTTGQLFPSAYSNYYVPNQYRAFYPDTSNSYYRYANGYVYEVDRSTSLIQALIPLLAGGYGMGQLLPASYSTYNVPYQYRSQYYDTANYNYRYAPGAIYQVDPRSNLITGVPMLLAGDLGVGRPLPLGYDAYNVPLAYRANYYDTPNAMYRYNDGNIYRVDPTTRLITAIISAII